jgi:hypothetical protein
MAFFADLPEPEAAEPPRWIEPEWRRVPHEFLPVSVPFSGVLFQDDEVAATIQGVEVYPTGVTFTLMVIRHPEWTGPHESLEQFAGRSGRPTCTTEDQPTPHAPKRTWRPAAAVHPATAPSPATSLGRCQLRATSSSTCGGTSGTSTRSR